MYRNRFVQREQMRLPLPVDSGSRWVYSASELFQGGSRQYMPPTMRYPVGLGRKVQIACHSGNSRMSPWGRVQDQW